jgi:methyl-accepting chemotaxis protein
VNINPHGIAFKFVSGSLLVTIAATFFVLFIVLPRLEATYLADRKTSLEQVADMANGILTDLQQQVASGEKPLATAQQEALRIIGAMRYRGNGYLWINDLTPTVLLNPGAPDLVGTNVGSYRDPKGKPVFAEFVRICREKRAGYVSYYTKRSTAKPASKLSYVRLFEPWGWIVGSGILLDDLEKNMADLRSLVLATAGLIIVINTGFIYLTFRRYAVRPLKRITTALDGIAAGRGDLTKRFTVTGKDEFGTLAAAFNNFVAGLQDMVRNVTGSHHEVVALTSATKQTVIEIKAAAGDQSATTETVAASLSRLDEAIAASAADVDHLQFSAQTASAATQQISSSISAITDTTEQLDKTADTIQGAVNLIATSLKQSTANLVVLAELTGSAVKAAARINESIRDIGDNAQIQAGLARDVKEAAETAGLGLVNRTRQGMEKIRSEVRISSTAIESLTDKSDAIGEIVGLIGDIADETNLLALNAAVLAAQAGPHGRAFSVVAEKVRSLARRSTASTKDIGAIIHQVQAEIALASTAIKRSSSQIEEGLVVSAEAEAAIRQIANKTEISLAKALEIESSVSLQSKNIALNVNSIESFRKMSADIKLGIDRQSKSATQILESVNELRTCSSLVKQSIADQAQESNHIAKLVGELFSLARNMAQSAASQGTLAHDMLGATATLNSQAEQNLAMATALEATMERLDAEAELLRQKFARFKTDA